jgi:hypothetical protein
MTVSTHRRRVATTRALVLALAALGVTAVLGVVGAVAIYNTTDGQVLGGDEAEVTFPDTPTGVIAVLDDSGDLSSLAAFAVRPRTDGEPGRGGSVVPVPVSADASGGFGTDRLPLNETVALFGPDSLADEIPVMLGVGIDQYFVLGRDELTEMLAPLGPIEVTLPSAVTDATGTEVAPAGTQRLDAEQLAAVLTSADPAVRGTDRYPVDVAVWQAITTAVGDGLAAPLSVEEGPGTTGLAGEASSRAPLLEQLTGGPISVQPLRATPITGLDVNPRSVDTVRLDPAELAVIFGHVAPSRVAAPSAGYNFRVVSSLGDDQLPPDVSRLDVAYTATKALQAQQANVLSVDTSAGEADTATVVEVSDESLVAAAEALGDVFGEVDVRVTDTPIAGIDVVVTVGTDYLSRLDASAATSSTAPTGSSATASAVTTTDGEA